MKKILPLILSVLMIICCTACSSITSEIRPSIPSEGISKFDSELDTQISNDNYNTSIYLTNKYFFFTTEDTSSTNSFGTPSKLLKYDLKSGEITNVLDFPTSEITDMILIENKLYFVTYTNTDTDWGFCLFSYDIESGQTERIYETPNTVDYIAVSSIENKLFYMCSTSPQNNSGKYTTYQIHMRNGNDDKILKDNIICKYSDFINEDNKIYINLYNDETDKALIIDKDGIIKDSEELKETDNSNEAEKINGKIVSGKFGKYYILENEIPDFSEDNPDSCGYRYSINYYIYNSESKEEKTLTPAFYWYYYI